MKKTKNIVLVLFLSLSLFLSGCFLKTSSTQTTSSTKEPSYNTEHTPFRIQDLSYQRPAVQEFETLVTDTIELTKTSGNLEALLSSYQSLLDCISDYDNMQTLASVMSDQDLTDEFYSSESEFLDSYYTKMDNKMLETTKTILDSEYSDDFKKKVGEEFIQRYEINSKLNSPEIEELSEKEVALVNEYKKASVVVYTTEYKGEEVSEEDLDFNDPNISVPYFEIQEKKNLALGEIYHELVQIRVEIAKKLGYSNYKDYAYDALGYKFTPDESSELEEKVIKYMATLSQQLSSKYDVQIANAMTTSDASFEDGIPMLKKAIEKEFPDRMLQALNYMTDNQLYNYTNDPNAMMAGYTTIFAKEAAPYMYINTNAYTDPSTVFHEFGHYYNFYHYFPLQWNDSNDLNLAEVHSQGLEVLMYPYYEELYGDDAQIMMISNILTMLNSILQGCAEDKFQQMIFDNPTMSLDEMNQLHGDIYTDYFGYPIYYEWVNIHHHFETPFYYISYATSALSALELWSISDNDRSKAVEIYDNIVKYNANANYIEALENSGLTNPFKSDSVSKIAKTIKKQLK